ncbi:MAG TPA: hypothetical protein VFJ07_10930 [Streptosporangiaceae bacterium]|nr:hypothetical protein [Streptosporangiaceae bacterium]
MLLRRCDSPLLLAATGHATDLAAGFRRDIHAWLMVLLDGDARTRPRSPATVRVHFSIVRPFIEHWAATRSHLREITSGNVDVVLGSLRRHRRYNAITALRSLFPVRQTGRPDFCRPHCPPQRRPGHRTYPAAHDRRGNPGSPAGGRHCGPPPGRRISSRARRPAQGHPRAHSGRYRPARRRITLTGHPQPLGQLTRTALLAWLGHRHATWPHTANRHVLVTRISALGTGPVSADYLDKHQLRGISLDHIRRDRILHEALATGADPLHLSLIFKVGHTNAMAYANAARNLLTSHAEQPPQPSGQAAVQRPAARTRRGARANNRVRDPPVKDVSGDRDR